MNQRINFLLLLAAFLFFLGTSHSTLMAQIPGGGGGGLPGGGGGGDPDMGGGNQPTTGGGGRAPAGGGGGGANVNTASQATNIDPSVARLVTTPDTRNQGFIGATASVIGNQGFVGAASDTSGPQIASGATFGGGVNRGNARGATGGRIGGGFNTRNGAGFSPLGSQNGFQVARAGTRSRLSLNFETPAIESGQILSSFVSSYQNLPATQADSQGYEINIVEMTAVVTGWVESQAEADRLISQLRLQPGVYKIDNQLRIRQ